MVNIASGEPRTPGHHFISSAPFIRCSHPIIFRTPVIEEAIKQSQQIWFEIDPKDESFGEKLRGSCKTSQGPIGPEQNTSEDLRIFAQDNTQRDERLASSSSLGHRDDPAKSNTW